MKLTEETPQSLVNWVKGNPEFCVLFFSFFNIRKYNLSTRGEKKRI